MDFNFSGFSSEFKRQYEDAIKDKKITADEFSNFSPDDQAKLRSIFDANPEVFDSLDIFTKEYHGNDSSFAVKMGHEGETDGTVIVGDKIKQQYPNAAYGKLNNGKVTIFDKNDNVITDKNGNIVSYNIPEDTFDEFKVPVVIGNFEYIENEPPERTNRRFAIALALSRYDGIVNELKIILAQMGALDVGFWREFLGFGVQVLADLKENQQAITATTMKKIERVKADRTQIAADLEKLIDSPAEFEQKFYQLFGKDYRDNAIGELREIMHNQEGKETRTKYKECKAKFDEIYPDSNVERWEESVEFQKTADRIADIVVMFVMTGGIGALFKGSMQKIAMNILKAAAKGDRKAVMANFAKLAPEVQTIYKSLAKKEFGLAAAQTVTPMAQSAATFATWEGMKAFINGATNQEDLSPEDLLSRTWEGIKSGAEMGVVMGGLETFAIGPTMKLLTPMINKLSGASSKIAELIESNNGVVSMEKIMETYTKTSQTLRGTIAKEGVHALVALPTFTVGFTGVDTAFHYDENEFRKSLLDAATTDEEREAINQMDSFSLRMKFAEVDFMNQVRGMATIEGVGLIFRRLQAGRLAAQSMQSGKAPDILNADLVKNAENKYELKTKDGRILSVQDGNKTISSFNSIEEAAAAYSSMCMEVYSEFIATLEKTASKQNTDEYVTEFNIEELHQTYNFDNFMQGLRNRNVSFDLFELEDGRKLVRIEDGTKLLSKDRFTYLEYGNDGTLSDAYVDISKDEAKKIFSDYANTKSRFISNKTRTLNSGLNPDPILEGIDAHKKLNSVKEEINKSKKRMTKAEVAKREAAIIEFLKDAKRLGRTVTIKELAEEFNMTEGNMRGTIYQKDNGIRELYDEVKGTSKQPKSNTVPTETQKEQDNAIAGRLDLSKSKSMSIREFLEECRAYAEQNNMTVTHRPTSTNDVITFVDKTTGKRVRELQSDALNFVSDEYYTYDEKGNIKTANRYRVEDGQFIGTREFFYDENGNRTHSLEFTDINHISVIEYKQGWGGIRDSETYTETQIKSKFGFDIDKSAFGTKSAAAEAKIIKNTIHESEIDKSESEAVTQVKNEYQRLKTVLENELIDGEERFSDEEIASVLDKIAQNPQNIQEILTELYTIKTPYGNIVDAEAYMRAMRATLELKPEADTEKANKDTDVPSSKPSPVERGSEEPSRTKTPNESGDTSAKEEKTVFPKPSGESSGLDATNIELVSKMEAALKANNLQEVMRLFEQMPDKAKQNVKGVVEKFASNGLTLETYLQACIKQQNLFARSPETIEKNIKGLVEKFASNGLTLDTYLSACIKQPPLFHQSPETIEKNIKGLVEKFESNGLSLDSYLSACVKSPQLFCQSPETIEKNVKGLIEKFEANGLSLESYLSACVKNPSLFYQSPETIEKNVKSLVEKFESNGLTLDTYLSACVKQPSLFSQSPETIEKNIKGLVEKFESNRLTLDAYLSAYVKQPQLFCQSPETIEKNVKGLVEKFEANGLSLDSYLSACVKQPSLFSLSPETIVEHINIIRFSQFNNSKEIDNEDFWSQVLKHPMDLTFSSSLLLTQGLIIPKMFENREIPKELKGNRLKQKLEEYLKAHPNDKYVLNIQNIPSETGQVEILRDYLAKLTKDLKLPKDMFKIVVTENKTKSTAPSGNDNITPSKPSSSGKGTAKARAAAETTTETPTPVSNAQRYEFKKPDEFASASTLKDDAVGTKDELFEKGQKLLANMIKNLPENAEIKEPKVLTVGINHFGFTIERTPDGNRLVTVKNWLGDKESWDIAAIVEEGLRFELDESGNMIEGKFFWSDYHENYYKTEYSYTYERQPDGSSTITSGEDTYSKYYYQKTITPFQSESRKYVQSPENPDAWIAKEEFDELNEAQSWLFSMTDGDTSTIEPEFGYDPSEVSLMNLFLDYARPNRAERLSEEMKVRTEKEEKAVPQETSDNEDVTDSSQPKAPLSNITIPSRKAVPTEKAKAALNAVKDKINLEQLKKHIIPEIYKKAVMNEQGLNQYIELYIDQMISGANKLLPETRAFLIECIRDIVMERIKNVQKPSSNLMKDINEQLDNEFKDIKDLVTAKTQLHVKDLFATKEIIEILKTQGLNSGEIASLINTTPKTMRDILSSMGIKIDGRKKTQTSTEAVSETKKDEGTEVEETEEGTEVGQTSGEGLKVDIKVERSIIDYRTRGFSIVQIATSLEMNVLEVAKILKNEGLLNISDKTKRLDVEKMKYLYKTKLDSLDEIAQKCQCSKQDVDLALRYAGIIKSRKVPDAAKVAKILNMIRKDYSTPIQTIANEIGEKPIYVMQRLAENRIKTKEQLKTDAKLKFNFDKEVVSLYNFGLKISDMQSVFECSRETLIETLQQNGKLNAQSKLKNPENYNEIKQCKEQGLGTKDIADLVEESPDVVNEILLELSFREEISNKTIVPSSGTTQTGTQSSSSAQSSGVPASSTGTEAKGSSTGVASGTDTEAIRLAQKTENEKWLKIYKKEYTEIESFINENQEIFTEEQKVLVEKFKTMLENVKAGNNAYEDIDSLYDQLLSLKTELEVARSDKMTEIKLLSEGLENIQKRLNESGIDFDLSDYKIYDGDTVERIKNAEFIYNTFTVCGNNLDLAVSIISHCEKYMDSRGLLDISRQNEYIFALNELDIPETSKTNVKLVQTIKKLVQDNKISRNQGVEYVLKLKNLASEKPLEKITITDFAEEFDINKPVERKIIESFYKEVYMKNDTKDFATLRNGEGTVEVTLTAEAKEQLSELFSDAKNYISKMILFEKALKKSAASENDNGIKKDTWKEGSHTLVLYVLKVIMGNSHIRIADSQGNFRFDTVINGTWKGRGGNDKATDEKLKNLARNIYREKNNK